jgi:hypothetical protein
MTIVFMRNTTNELSSEFLEMAPKEFGHSSSLINSSRICKSWRTVGQRVLWTDIAIKNLESVVESSETDSHALFPTLTLTLALPPLMPDDFIGYECQEELRSMKRLLTRIVDGLPKPFRKMVVLGSLSFRTVPHCPCGFFQPLLNAMIPVILDAMIPEILDALPPTVKCLEVDTVCLSATKEEVGHICPSICRVMPQLSDLRLEVADLCEECFHPNMLADCPDTVPVILSSLWVEVLGGALLTPVTVGICWRG